MYVRATREWLKHWDFMLLDMISLHLSFVIGYWMRHGYSNPYGNLVYRNMAMVLCLIEFISILGFGTLKNVLKRGYYKELVKTIQQVFWVLLLATFYLFMIQQGKEYSRLTLYYMVGFYAISSYFLRVGWKLFLKKQVIRKEESTILIITMHDMMDSVLSQIKSHNYKTLKVVGCVAVNQNLKGSQLAGVPVVANLNDIIAYVKSQWIDEVLFSLPDGEPISQDLVDQFTQMGIVVHIKLAESTDCFGEKRFVERMGNYTVLTTSMNYATPTQAFMKRGLDILGGLVGCVITGFLYLILAPAIKKESPGPVFFAQIRIGKNGKKFKLYKFRSMYLDAEERKKELMEQNRVKDGMMFKLDWDPRIIGAKQLPDGTTKKGIGHFVRDWSLDEFPQFYNVLKGDMSLVGTRPPTVDEWELYDIHHHARLAIKPGITGLWQVSGRSGITDFEEVVKLDKTYIATWNMGLDIRILLKTIRVVFGKDGAM